MKTVGYLFWGYNAIWVILAIYLYLLLSRLRRVESKAERLRERLEHNAQP